MKILNYLTSDEKKIAVFYAFVVFCLILFSVFIHFSWPAFDAQVISLVSQDRGKSFSGLMTFISWWGMSFQMTWTVLVVALLFRLASYKREAWFVLSVFPADVVNVLLKLIINRPRPHPQAMSAILKFQQSSFPSGHVVHYVVFFGFILTVMLVQSRIPRIVRWVISLLCVLLLAGVSIARIYAETHWPTDILAAYIIGFTMLVAVILQYLKGLHPHHEN